MTITAYRITRQQFAHTIWSGIGAREFGGRWNSKGVTVVYAAESRSLAALEQLVHLIKPRVLKGFVLASIQFESSRVQRVNPAGLPAGWDLPVAPHGLKQLGDNWMVQATFPVLSVPSAVIRSEFNYLFNPVHPEFAAMKKSTPEPFIFDDRLG